MPAIIDHADIGGGHVKKAEQCGASPLSNHTPFAIPPASTVESRDTGDQDVVEHTSSREENCRALALQPSRGSTANALPTPLSSEMANEIPLPSQGAGAQPLNANGLPSTVQGKTKDCGDNAKCDKKEASSDQPADAKVKETELQANASKPLPETSGAWPTDLGDSLFTEAEDAKNVEARHIALERMKLGSDANWPDEKEILDNILQRDEGPNDTALEFSVRYAAGRIQWRGKVAQQPTEHALGILMERSFGKYRGDENGLDEYSNIEEVHIYSEGMQNLVRETVYFYPDVDLYRSPLILHRPFDVLFHYCQSLVRNAKIKDLPLKDRDGVRALEYICAKKLRQFSIARMSFANGRTTQFFIPFLFRPGTLLYTTDSLEAPQIVVCLNYSFEHVRNASFEVAHIIVIRAWCMTWNWNFQRFQRQLVTFATDQFKGDKYIKSLPVYPLQYYGTSEEINRLKHDLVQRNRTWAKLVSQKPSCWLHDGTSWKYKEPKGPWELHEDHSRVIVDGKPSVNQVGNYKPVLVVTDNVKGWDNRPEHRTYDKITAASALTDDQLLLCVSMIRALDPVSNKYLEVSVHNLRPIIWNKTILDQLVLPQEKKDRLIRVLRDHLSEHQEVSSDIIDGKGQGLVIVLYGPPGVGKTLTAECVAEHMERILIHLPIRDLVANERVVEDISDKLDEADRHGAIVLLDEADVILEKRSLEDVKRNGLVSSFLRTLEYFTGIIIMTTNRTATIDIAFQSRIHLAIEYSSASISTRRKIWTMFINRLTDADADAREDLLEHVDELKRFNLNGRQIRNAVKVAKGLAGGQRLTFAHFKQAVDEASEFSHYFKNESDTTRSKLKVSLKGKGKSLLINAPQKEEDDEDDEDN